MNLSLLNHARQLIREARDYSYDDLTPEDYKYLDVHAADGRMSFARDLIEKRRTQLLDDALQMLSYIDVED